MEIGVRFAILPRPDYPSDRVDVLVFGNAKQAQAFTDALYNLEAQPDPSGPAAEVEIVDTPRPDGELAELRAENTHYRKILDHCVELLQMSGCPPFEKVPGEIERRLATADPSDAFATLTVRRDYTLSDASFAVHLRAKVQAGEPLDTDNTEYIEGFYSAIRSALDMLRRL